MKREEKQDVFIRKILADQGPEKAPNGFSDRVMARLAPSAVPDNEPIFSPMVWFSIFLGAAALVITMIFVDIPYINDTFSSIGVESISDILNNSTYRSFVTLFKSIHLSSTLVIIIAAALSLVLIERIFSSRRPSQGLMLF